MSTKNELDAILTDVMVGIRGRVQLPIPSMLPYSESRFDALIEKCVDLQKELSGVADPDPRLFDLQKQVLSLEAEYHRLRTRLLLMPSVILLYIGGALAFALLKFIDIPKFITGTLGVQAPERLISLGIAGAFLYLATSLLTKVEAPAARNSQFSTVADFTIRLSMAVVVPIVLVVLFFTKEGEIGRVKLSPEIMSFACGYSAKLVIDLFAKIVEKCSKMIQA